MTTHVRYTKPSITDVEINYVMDAARYGWGERCYEYVDRFERLFCTHLGVKHAIATSSCTGALHMGLAALGVAPGDEVILADINWIASAAPITYLQATPVLVDILPDTWCLDPEKVEAAITPRTKAIIAVHLYGNLCDMDRLRVLGKTYGIPIVEDAAEAIGSVWRGKPAGSMGAFGAFSFHGTKTITTGEGGMFVTNDDDLFEKVLTYSNHGRARSEVKQFWPETVGFKYKLSNLQAAIGCAQIERAQELIARKREIFLSYKQALSGLPLAMNIEPPETVNGYWMPTIVIEKGVPFNRHELLESFKQAGIDGRVFFWPLSTMGFFSHAQHTPVSSDISLRGINLPSYHDLTAADIDRVVSALIRCLVRTAA
jgi:perosamine synthetase